MAFELKPNQGSLFFNERKSKPSHPDYTGRLLIVDANGNGREWRLAGWKRSLKSGVGYLSLQISPPRDANQGEINFEKPTPTAETAAETSEAVEQEFNDKVPF
jgi:hypothetical protein